jgi:hypothetical protein
MNTRRKLLFILSASALLLRRTSLAQQQESKKSYQIGFLTRKTDASVLIQIGAFRQELHDLGWIEGKNINLFHLRRDHVPADQYRAARTQAFQTWSEITGAAALA